MNPFPNESAPTKFLLLSNEDECSTKTRLLELPNKTFFSYSQVPWTLHLKKEVFSPSERLEHSTSLDLIFLQVMKDYVATPLCIRMTEKDKNQLTNLLETSGYINPVLSSDFESFTDGLKRQIVDTARDWPYYFTRLFPVAVSGLWHFYSAIEGWDPRKIWIST